MKKLRTFIFLITAVLFTNSCGNSEKQTTAENLKSKNDSLAKIKTDSLKIIETIQIGTQIWTAKNLDVFTYQNGDTITEVKNIDTLKNIQTGAWCYYNFDAKNGKKYGKLYNRYAVNDPRGLAPKGFHIPTYFEYNWYNNPTLNEKGFNALPGGYFGPIFGANPNFYHHEFYDLGGVTYFACRDYELVYLECEQCKFENQKDNEPKPEFFSVRCIKD